MNFITSNGIENFYFEKHCCTNTTIKRAVLTRCWHSKNFAGKIQARISQKLNIDDSIIMTEIPEKMLSSAKIEDTKSDHVCLVCRIEGKHNLLGYFLSNQIMHITFIIELVNIIAFRLLQHQNAAKTPFTMVVSVVIAVERFLEELINTRKTRILFAEQDTKIFCLFL